MLGAADGLAQLGIPLVAGGQAGLVSEDREAGGGQGLLEPRRPQRVRALL